MTDIHVDLPTVPLHIEETIRSIARLHAEHHQNATPIERAVDRMTALLGRPKFIGVLTVILVAWISSNLLAAALDYHAIDPPPFSWLQGGTSIVALYMVVLVLVTQRREDLFSQHRQQLILELAMLGEQKTTKVIQLLEESRRDNPLIRDRVDSQAEAMARPADAQTVLEAIKETRAEAEQTSRSADST
ncbi:MAG: DUF1003 domain-containing protein [Pseudomonadota bacterium]